MFAWRSCHDAQHCHIDLSEAVPAEDRLGWINMRLTEHESWTYLGRYLNGPVRKYYEEEMKKYGIPEPIFKKQKQWKQKKKITYTKTEKTTR